MSIQYTISLPAGAQMELATGINRLVLPMMHQTVKAIAQQAQQDWQQAVLKAKLWSGEKDAYMQSIRWEMTGDFSASIWTDYKNAHEIESGRPQRDLKKMLDTSQKVRRTDKGKRFLVIPFRHNTPGNTAHANAMPADVYQMAKELGASRVVSTGERPSGQVMKLSPKSGMQPAPKQTPFLSSLATKGPMMVKARHYAWGERLTKTMLKQAGLDRAEQRRYAGMVRFDTSTPGGSTSSAYMTFRIMMEGQTGKWIVPSQPGLYLARGVAQALAPKAKKAFELAAQKLAVSG